MFQLSSDVGSWQMLLQKSVESEGESDSVSERDL